MVALSNTFHDIITLVNQRSSVPYPIELPNGQLDTSRVRVYRIGDDDRSADLEIVRRFNAQGQVSSISLYIDLSMGFDPWVYPLACEQAGQTRLLSLDGHKDWPETAENWLRDVLESLQADAA